MTEQEKAEQHALARRYREAAAGDAVHGLANGDPTQGDNDMTLVVTPERPGVPMHDVAHPDPVDSENHDAPPSPLGPYHDALMRGLEPGETSAE